MSHFKNPPLMSRGGGTGRPRSPRTTLGDPPPPLRALQLIYLDYNDLGWDGLPRGEAPAPHTDQWYCRRARGGQRKLSHFVTTSEYSGCRARGGTCKGAVFFLYSPPVILQLPDTCETHSHTAAHSAPAI